MVPPLLLLLKPTFGPSSTCHQVWGEDNDNCPKIVMVTIFINHDDHGDHYDHRITRSLCLTTTLILMMMIILYVMIIKYDHYDHHIRWLCLTNLFCWSSLVCYSLYFTGVLIIHHHNHKGHYNHHQPPHCHHKNPSRDHHHNYQTLWVKLCLRGIQQPCQGVRWDMDLENYLMVRF